MIRTMINYLPLALAVPMFKGGLSGFSWELVNDDIRFDANVLEAFY